MQNDHKPRRGKGDPGPSRVVRKPLGQRTHSGPKRLHVVPSIGDRFGQLRITGYRRGSRGGITAFLVSCSCGRREHPVAPHSLYRGASTRCNVCAKKQTGHWIKHYYGYADIVPDDALRTRLLNRISSCISRCHCRTNAQFIHYGARGIEVFKEWRQDRRKFLAYLITLPGHTKPELEIDRREVDRGYEPGNLRFATKKQNAGNKRKIRVLQARILELEARLGYSSI